MSTQTGPGNWRKGTQGFIETEKTAPSASTLGTQAIGNERPFDAGTENDLADWAQILNDKPDLFDQGTSEDLRNNPLLADLSDEELKRELGVAGLRSHKPTTDDFDTLTMTAYKDGGVEFHAEVLGIDIADTFARSGALFDPVGRGEGERYDAAHDAAHDWLEDNETAVTDYLSRKYGSNSPIPEDWGRVKASFNGSGRDGDTLASKRADFYQNSGAAALMEDLEDAEAFGDSLRRAARNYPATQRTDINLGLRGHEPVTRLLATSDGETDIVVTRTGGELHFTAVAPDGSRGPAAPELTPAQHQSAVERAAKWAKDTHFPAPKKVQFASRANDYEAADF